MPNTFLPNIVPGVASNLLTGKFISNGEAVTATVANRIPRINSANENYLHELLKRSYNNSGEFLWNQPISSDVQVGHFVYFNSITRRFEKALAKYVAVNGVFQESESSAVWGLVIAVKNNQADICTNGLCNLTPAIECYKTLGYTGEMFLQDLVAGEPSPEIKFPYKCLGCLIGVKPSGEIQFFVRINLTADPRLHDHRAYELAAAPAGNWTSDSDAISDINLNIPGWLPASHAIFNGEAPVNAVYGYNPKYLESCQWSLVFTSAAGLRWQRKSNATDDPLLAAVPPEFYIINDTTIWWLIDDLPFLPWDSSAEYTNGTATPVDALLPPQYTQRIWLELINMGYGLTDQIVASLRPEKDSGLYIRQYPFGCPAITGDLEIGFNPPFAPLPETIFQSYAVSDIDTDWNIQRTASVSGIKIDSTRLKVIQSDQITEGFHYGKITIGDPTGMIGRELPFEAIHLQGVEEAVEREAIGLAFPASRAASLLARVTSPLDTAFNQFGLTLFFGILLPHTGNIAADIFKLSYRIISNPPATQDISKFNTAVQAFPESQLQPLNCDFQVSSNTYLTSYYTAQSEKLVIKPGDILLLKMERTPPDNFPDRIIILRKSAILHAN
ncbi:MAG: hypothetical protein LBJ00_06035 [Planctomycetaceae bacterium]|jgi:hypothetical protein|nr:hypothetical protein [Planctomycetaceae bacterium]